MKNALSIIKFGKDITFFDESINSTYNSNNITTDDDNQIKNIKSYNHDIKNSTNSNNSNHINLENGNTSFSLFDAINPFQSVNKMFKSFMSNTGNKTVNEKLSLYFNISNNNSINRDYSDNNKNIEILSDASNINDIPYDDLNSELVVDADYLGNRKYYC